MNRKASAVWRGSARRGAGFVSSGSGLLGRMPYDYGARFGEDLVEGTNPEELIGAAHAGCFSMALSEALEQAGTPPETIETQATVRVDRVDGEWMVAEVHLDVLARVPGSDEDSFRRAAEAAKIRCPISRLLKAEVTMDTRLVGA